MRDSLAHRGPDDAGLWMSRADGVTLGSRRLAILDLSPRGHQPMQDASGTLTIVFNGEIYNYAELRKELQVAYPFQSRSDTEVLLAAYSCWGPDFVHRLNGMFAFAIWDSKRRHLFAARDRFGEKPFYCYRRPSLFLFASEIKAILASGMVVPEPHLQSIYKFLAYRETDTSQETFFKNILALPPAHTLLYSPSADALKITRYWDVDPSLEVRYSDKRNYADHLLELLRNSVKIRLRSDVQVGSCLSGGLDSSSIVSLVAAQRNGNRQCTFSARFADRNCDEGTFIEPVTQRFLTANYGVYPDPHRMVEEVDQLAWRQEHPFTGPSIYAQWCVMRLAADYGVTVLLDGQGADEILAGYLASRSFHYWDLLRQLRWISFAKSAWEQMKSNGIKSITGMTPQSLLAESKWLPGSFLEPLSLTPEFSKIAGCPPTPVPEKFKSSLHNELYRQLTCSMLPKLLRFADRSSMAFSREVRLPYLDHRVVEYLFAIPESQKIQGGATKFVLREAMRGRLPDKVLRRTDKKGFDTPQSAWLQGAMRPWVEDILRSNSFRQRGWIDHAAAVKVWKRFRTHPVRNQALLFRWLSLEMWARTFLKPSTAFQFRLNPSIETTLPLEANTRVLVQDSEM